LKIQDIYLQEKGKDALKKKTEKEETAAAPKVAGGVKGKKKAQSKSAAKAAKAAKGTVAVSGKKSAEKTAAAGEVSKSVDKILKYTPSK
jgi:hypothetical protein